MSFASTDDLSTCSVLVVGMGGLGCPASLSLAQAGVGKLTLVDPDRVEWSNLPRQLWHRQSDLSRLKVDSAAEKLKGAFPHLGVEALPTAVTPQNASELFARHDLVVDGTDGVAVKFLLSDTAVRTGVPLVYGGVLRLQGQVMLIASQGPCLRCLFEEAPLQRELPTCAQAGVLGTVAGLVGALQGQLAVAALRNRPVAGTLWTLDARNLRQRTVAVPPALDCPSCGAPSNAPLPQGQVEAMQVQSSLHGPAYGAGGEERGQSGDGWGGAMAGTLDIRNDSCPMTYVRTKLSIDALREGDTLEVLLRGQEPRKNVPQSAEAEGHRVMSVEELSGGDVRVRIRKGGGAS